MAVMWMGEACDFRPEPQTGTRVTRFTATPLSNINIYCEQPYTTPDGKRFAVLRSSSSDPRMPPAELCVVDLQTYRIARVEPVVRSVLVATAGYSGILYYLDGDLHLVRFNMMTFERSVLCDWTLSEDVVFHSATPDGCSLIGTIYESDYHTALLRVDLQSGQAETIYRHPEILTHVQVNPANGRDILVQLNRGVSINDKGESRKFDNPLTGATHFIIDIGGDNLRPLAIGEPYTSSSTGHSAWAGDTGRIGLSVSYPWDSVNQPGALDERYPIGNFFLVGPADAAPLPFETPNHRFNHVGMSHDGKYFVCDCYVRGVPYGVALVMGNVLSGKHRTLVADCGATAGCAGNSHPHPYITSDNRHVIFNSDRSGICHVHAAHVTDDFLQSLE